ncbi:MAG TPA: PAS domain S-box protein [Cytophagaceae bacterium]
MSHNLIQSILSSDYASFLQTEQLEDLIALTAKKMLDADFASDYFTREKKGDLETFIRTHLEHLLSEIQKGKMLKSASEFLKEWMTDRIPELPSQAFNIAEYISFYALTRKVLIEMVPQYTREVEVATALILEIEELYQTWERYVLEVEDNLRKEQIKQLSSQLSQEREEKKAAEDKLDATLGYSQVLISNLTNGVFSYDENFNLTEWNPVMEQITGLDKVKVIGTSVEEIQLTNHKDQEKAAFARVLGGEKVSMFECSYKHRYGSFDFHLVPLFSGQKVKGAIGIIKDITERKQAENKIKDNNKALEKEILERKKTEERLQQLAFFVNSSHEAILSVSLDDLIVSWNKGAEKLFGYKEEEVLGKPYTILVPEEKTSGYLAGLEKLRNGENIVDKETERKKKNGKKVAVLKNMSPIRNEAGEVIGYGAILKDISQQKKAEERLEETRHFVAQVVELNPDMLYVYDFTLDRLVYLNKAITNVLGFELEEFNASWEEVCNNYVHPDDRDKLEFNREFFRLLKEGKSVEQEYRLRSREGEWRWIYSKIASFKWSKDKKPQQILGVSRDITKLKLAEEKIKKSEMLLKEAQEMAHVGNYEWNINNNLIEGSDELYRIFGVSPEVGPVRVEMLKKFSSSREWEELEQQARQAAETNTAFAYEQRIVLANGSEKILAGIAKPVKDETGTVKIKGVAQDITERKKAEVELQIAYEELKKAKEELVKINNDLENRVLDRTRELNSINEELKRINVDLDNFVYTASHDLKAPISNIEGLIDALDAELAPENIECKHIIGLMKLSVSKFKGTIKDLSEISRMQKNLEEEISLISFSDMVEDVKFSIIEMISSSGATIFTDFEACPEISFSRKNLKSILYNLISNAIKYRSNDRKPEVIVRTDLTDEWIILTVKDNGLGFKNNNSSKIFGMFKRLHDHVEGTGIGLYIVKRIIENAEGKIEVESEVGVGTIFRIYFKR